MKNVKNTPVLFDTKDTCCGCTLCATVCPKSIITMEQDQEGFLYPVINSNNCINCRKCVSVCPFKDFKSPKNQVEFYAVGLKNKEEIKKSSSGGVFTGFSNVILENGGAIACSIYDYKSHSLEFRLITSKEDRNKARGSMYLQSNPKSILKKCYSWLKDNPEKELMFVGTGCQADAFHKYALLKKIRDRVYIVDMVCHGAPSPMVWQDFIKNIEKSNSVVIDMVNFRDKRRGWNKPTAIASAKGKEFIINEYLRLFHKRYILRPSCHKCPYATFNRNSDVTIGDFQKIEKKIPEFDAYMGASVVLVQSKKGKTLYEKASKDFNTVKTVREYCMQPNLAGPSAMRDDREQFWSEYKSNGMEFVAHKYGSPTIKEKIKSKIRRLINIIKK